MKFLFIFLAAMSVVAYLIFRADKRRAVKEKYRIPESTLLLVTFLGGTLGAVLAMISLRHKNRKFSFLVKFIFVVLIQIGLFYLITLRLRSV